METSYLLLSRGEVFAIEALKGIKLVPGLAADRVCIHLRLLNRGLLIAHRGCSLDGGTAALVRRVPQHRLDITQFLEVAGFEAWGRLRIIKRDWRRSMSTLLDLAVPS